MLVYQAGVSKYFKQPVGLTLRLGFRWSSPDHGSIQVLTSGPLFGFCFLAWGWELASGLPRLDSVALDGLDPVET